MGVAIEAVELRRVRLPLVAPFRTSFGTQTERDILLVRVLGDGVEGWGECVALAEPSYSEEFVEGAVAVMAHHLLPLLQSRPSWTAEEIGPGLSSVKGHPMAKAAIELAVLDAQLRLANLSLSHYLGAVVDRVPSGVSVGIAASIPALLEVVGSYLDQGYVRVKLKIEPGFDIEPVRAVRKHFGDALILQVDANAAYSLGDADHLRQLDDLDLVLIEQPLEPDDLAGHAELARHLRTPICLDESITSVRTTIEAIERGACAIVNIKAGRVGGYLAARQIHDCCLERGVPVWCGGMLETGLGRAANIALAALPGFTLPGDISASARYFEHDLTVPFVLDGGHLHVPTGPGIGVVPDLAFLEEVTTWVELVPWPY